MTVAELRKKYDFDDIEIKPMLARLLQVLSDHEADWLDTVNYWILYRAIHGFDNWIPYGEINNGGDLTGIQVEYLRNLGFEVAITNSGFYNMSVYKISW